MNNSIDFGRGSEAIFIDPDSSLFEKPLSTTMEEASITARSRSPHVKIGMYEWNHIEFELKKNKSDLPPKPSADK